MARRKFPWDLRPVPWSDLREVGQPPAGRSDRLAGQAAEAARVRALSNHPDVIALRVEKTRSQVDVLIWAGIVLGLGFTMVNVQHFAAAGAAAWSLPWLAAWLLDPMVSLVLMAVLLAEQVTARYQVPAAPWARRAKWFAFTATYTMNTWQSWASLDAAGIVLHSVPPIGVLCAAEAAPWLRDRLTEAVHAAAREASTATVEPSAAEAAPFADTDLATVAATRKHPDTAQDAADTAAAANASAGAETRAERASANASTTRARTAGANGGRGRASAGRKLAADYVAEARGSLVPGIEITPAWVRQVTDCSRSTSVKVAAALRAEREADTGNAIYTPAITPSPTEHASAETETDMRQEVAA